MDSVLPADDDALDDGALSIEDELRTLRREVRHWLWRLLLGTVLLIPLAWIVFVSAWPDRMVLWVGLLLVTPIFLAIGWPLLQGALRAPREPLARADLLLALAVMLAYGAGIWHLLQFLRQAGESIDASTAGIYGTPFVDAALILTFLALGKYLYAVAVERFGSPLRELSELTPDQTVCVREGQQAVVPTSEVTVGETILIHPGRRVPLNARVLSGVSQLDQVWLTGDPRPIDCAPGAEIVAGTLNDRGTLIASVTAARSDSAPHQIAELLRRGRTVRSDMQRRIRWLAQALIAIVLLTAIAAAGLWLLSGRRHDALQAATAVLLAASVSALALTAATAVQAGCSRGALQGVLFTGGAAAEDASALTTVVVDKSAICPGPPRVVELIPHDGVHAEELLVTAATAAQYAEDPRFSCIHAEANRRGLRVPAARGHAAVDREGLAARTLLGETRLGRDAWFDALGVDASPLGGTLAAMRAAGYTGWVVSVGARLFGTVAVADVVAPYSRQAVGQLRAMGLRVVLLSGESPAITAGIAREVTFDEVLADVATDRKPLTLAQMRKPGAQIAWVGTGAEDNASLAAADLGVALNVGGQIQVPAADVILPGDLRGVGRAILLSRAMVGTIRTNLGFVLAYNAILIPLAAIGLVPPVLAAAATTVCTTAVIANSLLLLRRRID